LLNKSLQVYFGSLAYTQILSPTTLAQVGYELTFLDGFQDNPYLNVPNLGHAKAPSERIRQVAVARVAHYWPIWRGGAQVHYRFYLDHDTSFRRGPWGLAAHTIEARLHKELGDFDIRLAYRFHSQGAASFWCNTDPTSGGRTDCYGRFPDYYSADVKFGEIGTHAPEIKVVWELRWFARWPVLRWFSPGAAEISYGHYFQDTRYGNAHLLQTGYSLPF
jgi:hypothetical protein